jgi:GDP-L-fucose synthase
MNKTTAFDLKGKKIWVAGHRGMAGSAICRRLAQEEVELLSVEHARLDLRDQRATESWIYEKRPQVIFLAAARVGGILANDTYPATFLYDNLMIEANIIHAAYKSGVEKLVFLGSTCIYPKDARQPIAEEALLSGPLETTNQWYAIAKIAGLKLCQAYRRQYGCDFIVAQPTNLYGPGDNYNAQTSHVVPALIRKAYEARMAASLHLTIWGSGKPRREFLHVDDLADALVFLARNYSGEMAINIGSGEEISIAHLAEMICQIVGYNGSVHFDTNKPDGTMRKLADISRLRAMGWSPAIGLREGLENICQQFLAENMVNDVTEVPVNQSATG